MLSKKRLVTLFIGLSGNWAIVYGFDFVLYPYAMITFGTVQGWVIMTLASLALCLLTLWFYDWSKKDWIGIETIKSLRDSEATSRVGRVTAWMLQKSDPVVLVFLSIKFDPLITALYMRRGSHKFDGFSRRDWIIFSISMIISNLYWGLIVLAGIDIVQWLWAHVR